jgi:CRISPR-associated protein Cas2
MTIHKPSQAKSFVVVTYDISDDRRRTRLHSKLKNFGTAVQYSVFEAILDSTSLVRMKKMIRSQINEEDHVRLYLLCRKCQEKIIAIHGSVTKEERTIVV